MEVHASGTPQQHINLVRRVLDPSGKRIVGHLMVSFPMQGVQRILERYTTSGFVELQQVAAGDALVMGARGDHVLKEGPARGLADISGSGWRIAYWLPSSMQSNRNTLLLIGLMSAAVIALLLLPLGWLLHRKLARALQADKATLLTIVQDFTERRVKVDYPAAVAELADTIDLVARDVRTAASKVAIKPTGESGKAKQATPGQAAGIDELAGDLLFDKSGMEVSFEPAEAGRINASIFRAYDIRGVVGDTLDDDVAYRIGRAIGSEAYFRGEQTLVVGRDGRLSGPDLTAALIRGLKSTGRDVIDVGEVATPVLYFAAQHLGAQSGVMVTGSHNPAEYNGFKIVLGGETLAEGGIQDLYRRIENEDLLTGEGSVRQVDVLQDYLAAVNSDVQLARKLKVVVDCGNGVAGNLVPALVKALGCEVIELFCDVDGNFPNHHPDPSKPENLSGLIQTVLDNKADIGLAFDGDGDRIGVVTSQGAIVWPDRLMMLYARDVLSRNPGAQIIYDVKCSRNLARIIAENGGEPLMWQTGHSLIKAKMRETGALLAGEMSGHIFFKERWFGFDDALYSAARLLEILSNEPGTTAEQFAALPDSVNTPELNVPMSEGEPALFMEQLRRKAQFENAQISTIDGIRVEFERGWGLVRASNTTPCLVLRFEADDELAMSSIQEAFRREMLAVNPGLSLPF
jgi:phosphomannomutase/phosphoglucomutase